MHTLINHVNLIGNIGQEPQVTTLESGSKVVRFSLATNENYRDSDGNKQEETNWHTIVAWNGVGEIIEKYATKGSKVGIVGKLRTRSYETEDGNQRYVTEVRANEVLLLDGKKN
ncbi:MAG TPA: single-stranded DNA-binding protein [Pricia sp.]|nr:single-stranded DNA-binding protein [Pricia sp.]